MRAGAGPQEDLRHVALSAPHARTRERALALYEITQGSCATRVAARTGRHPQTVMGWVHAYQPVDEVLNWSSTHNIWRTKLRATALRSRSIAEQRLRQRAVLAGLLQDLERRRR